MNGKTGAFSVRRGAIRAAMNVVLLVAVAVVLVFSVFLVRNKMLQNTQALGMALARSYAAEAEFVTAGRKSGRASRVSLAAPPELAGKATRLKPPLTPAGL